MKVVAFRVDSSLEMGSGHVVRCMTLARSLTSLGAECHFLCSDIPGNIISVLRDENFQVHTIPASLKVTKKSWDWRYDLKISLGIIRELNADLILLDHYLLGFEWEKGIQKAGICLAVLDDISNRLHSCDIFIDQNFCVNSDEIYDGILPDCELRFLGPHYSIVRPEFAELRKVSFKCRTNAKKQSLLVFISGSDPSNETGLVLEGLQKESGPWDELNVVVGLNNPHIPDVEQIVSQIPITDKTIHVQISNMAKLMVSADFAILGGGTVTWEKCVLGLPSLVVSTADNQLNNLTKLHRLGAHISMGSNKYLTSDNVKRHLRNLDIAALTSMSNIARGITDGMGSDRLANLLVGN